MTDKQLLAREYARERKRQWMYHKMGVGRRFVYIDSLPKDENGENDLDRLGFFSDKGKGAMAIRSFDENAADRLRSTFRYCFDSVDKQLTLKILANGKETRERTYQWILQSRINKRYRHRKSWRENYKPRSVGISTELKK